MDDAGRVIQLVPRPAVNLLVCTCKYHPVWSCGHETFSNPPAFEQTRLTGVSDGPVPVTTNCISPAGLVRVDV